MCLPLYLHLWNSSQTIIDATSNVSLRYISQWIPASHHNGYARCWQSYEKNRLPVRHRMRIIANAPPSVALTSILTKFHPQVIINLDVWKPSKYFLDNEFLLKITRTKYLHTLLEFNYACRKKHGAHLRPLCGGPTYIPTVLYLIKKPVKALQKNLITAKKKGKIICHFVFSCDTANK